MNWSGRDFFFPFLFSVGNSHKKNVSGSVQLQSLNFNVRCFVCSILNSTHVEPSQKDYQLDYFSSPLLLTFSLYSSFM